MGLLMESKSLRFCHECGLTAWNSKDLEIFAKDHRLNYGRKNLCKPCQAKIRRERRKNYVRSTLYEKLQDMKKRCYNPNSHAYHRYGERGIVVCQEWLDNHDAFVDWALIHGFKRGLRFDRVDNSGPYSPENCRWATRIEQGRNMRNNVTDWEKGTRICSRCKVEKTFSKFHKNRAMSAGYA